MSTPDGSREGTTIELTDALRSEAVLWALQYRGDVTFTMSDGSTHTGYAFDQTDSMVRYEQDGGHRGTVAREAIVAITFSGRDMAAGKSFDRWIARYIEKRLAGQTAEIASESLD